MSSVSNGLFGGSGNNTGSTTYVATTPYQILVSDNTILVDTATIAAASTIYLPEAGGADGQVWTVKDESGSAGTYPITVESTDADIDIDGATTFVLSKAYESASFIWSASLGKYFYIAEVNASGGSSTSTTYVDISPYTVLLTDDVMLLDTADWGPITILLPDAPPTDGQVWTVKDKTGDGGIYPITVTTVSGATLIDNATTFIMTNAYSSASFVWSTYANQYYFVDEANVPTGNIILPTTTATVGQIIQNGAPLLQTYSSSPTGYPNVFLGYQSGSLTLANGNNACVGGFNMSSVGTGSANSNTLIGVSAGLSMVNSQQNTIVGNYAFDSSDVSYNTVLGTQSLRNLNSGNGYNIAIGVTTGNSYNSNESSNIVINNSGTTSESNVLRIGAGTGTGQQQLNAAYISGIYGINNTGGLARAVTIDQNGQLGSASGVSTTYVDTGTYTVLSTDSVMLLDTNDWADPMTVLLPEAGGVDGQIWTVKDKTGQAAVYNITVQSVSGDINIDNATTYVINANYGAASFEWSTFANQYYVISKY